MLQLYDLIICKKEQVAFDEGLSTSSQLPIRF